MEMTTGLTVALILVALAVLMQAGAMLGIYLAVRKVPAQIEGVRADVKQRIDPLSRSITEIVNNSREPLQTISNNLAEISDMLRNRASNADEVAADLLDKSRTQIARVDTMVTGLVAKVETTAEAVQKGVLGPISEISAVVKGVRSGLEFLFKHRRVANVSEATQDEQLFILILSAPCGYFSKASPSVSRHSSLSCSFRRDFAAIETAIAICKIQRSRNELILMQMKLMPNKSQSLNVTLCSWRPGSVAVYRINRVQAERQPAGKLARTATQLSNEVLYCLPGWARFMRRPEPARPLGPGGIAWTVPTGWEMGPEHQMRIATYRIHAIAGDPDDAECAVYFFGTGQGGSVEANLSRWAGQFTGPDGQAPKEAPKTDQRRVGGLKISTLTASGTYLGAGGMMGQPSAPKPNYRMRAAIVEAPEGLVFFKLAGPVNTVASSEKDFDALLNSVHRP